MKAIVILRHNTSLAGDVRLAAREFDALMGQPGGAISSRRELVAALEGDRVAYVPELSTNTQFVAFIWKNASLEGVTRLIRRSAFAQEVLIQGANPRQIEVLQTANQAVVFSTPDLAGSVLVGIAWNYLIESEGALDEALHQGRVARTIDLLVHPFLTVQGSRASQKLRRAKKTTLSLSHDLHIYKAKFFPRMVRSLINIFGTAAGPLFDPFCGSGTALLEASLLGIDCVGIDIDPICQLISRTKVEPFLNGIDLLNDLSRFEGSLLSANPTSGDFQFPPELQAKIARRDRIDGTNYLPEVTHEAAVLASALMAVPKGSLNRQLLSVIASDAVTKKVRYRFIGVGNGKYTIEIMKQPLLGRVREKIERCRQLIHVFRELRDLVGVRFGSVKVAFGDARELSSWPSVQRFGGIITSPPYLPASSGREHYASSRALAFAVLGFKPGESGYYDVVGPEIEEPDSLDAFPEASKLLAYLTSDASTSADPQRDAMRFSRKAIPTHHYLVDVASFLRNAMEKMEPEAALLFVVAHQHTFYSHRRQEIEHVVSGVKLYSEIAASAGLDLSEEIKMELLKSAVSRARPRAKDDYSESILVLRPRRSRVIRKTTGRRKSSH